MKPTMSPLRTLTETARSLNTSKSEAVWDRSVLGYSKAELDEMDADERARTLYELLNQASDLAEAIAAAFAKDLKATNGFHPTKSAAAELKMAARNAFPKEEP